MSGIFAYTGDELCRDILTDGIAMLEHRGNAACKTALKGENGVTVFTLQGSPSVLKKKAQSIKNEGFTGLAQCKYITKPLKAEAALSEKEPLALACDGRIENFTALKQSLSPGIQPNCEEALLATLLIQSGESNPLKRIPYALKLIEGNPTFVYITSGEEAIYCRAGDSPLAVGICDEGIAVASEASALFPEARRFFFLEDGEIAVLTKERATVYNEKLRRIKKPYQNAGESAPAAPHSFSDEFYLLPGAVKNAVNALKNGFLFAKNALTPREAEKIRRVIITGSRSSRNAGILGVHFIEQLSDLPCVSYSSAELRYAPELFGKSVLVIALSSSGEDTDTVACVKRAQEFGAKTLAVTASPCSYLAYLCDYSVHTGVPASTFETGLLPFVSGAAALCMLAMHIATGNETVSEIYYNVALKIAETVPGKTASALKPSATLTALAGEMINCGGVILTGFCCDGAVCRDAAGKIRARTGLMCFYESPAALEGETAEFLSGKKIIAVITCPEYAFRAAEILLRLKSLGADITVIAGEGIEEENPELPNVLTFPDTIPLFNWVSATALLYRTALTAGELAEEEKRSKAV